MSSLSDLQSQINKMKASVEVQQDNLDIAWILLNGKNHQVLACISNVLVHGIFRFLPRSQRFRCLVRNDFVFFTS